MQKGTLQKIRTLVTLLWTGSLFVVLFVYFFKPALFHSVLVGFFGTSLLLGYFFYFLFGALRGFFLIPVTYFIIIGLLFFPPLPLYLLTLSGVLISSTTLYFFADFLDLDAFFVKKYPHHIARLRTSLQKNELSIVIFWSFFPFAPTDLICYTCGALEVNFKKFIFGVFVGESVACALYIFLGDYFFRTLF